MSTPYVGFGNDQLKDCLSVKKGDLVECKNCNGVHPIEYGTSQGKESDMLGFYQCGDKSFLASVAGKLVMGVKPACAGKI